MLTFNQKANLNYIWASCSTSSVKDIQKMIIDMLETGVSMEDLIPYLSNIEDSYRILAELIIKDKNEQICS